MKKKIGLIAFASLALLVLVMAWATLVEHARGTAHVGYQIYNSVWFTLLWILMATTACYFISECSLHRRLSVFLLHVSFLAVLFGALTTRLTGKTGQIHLRENHAISSFFDEWTRSKVEFPFSLALKTFEIEYYPGTASPANYVSVVELSDAKTGERSERKISMNNILRYKSYRFYQSSFDEDLQGSILSVNHDTWGILLTYAGYYLMFLSMILVLIDKRERFRFLLRKLGSKTAMVVLLTISLPTLSAQQPERVEYLSASNILVDYHGRITPIQTLANDFTMKLAGKSRYKSFSAEQVFFGWLLFPDDWKHVPMFELKSKELKRMSGVSGSYASLADFTNEAGRNILEPYYHQMYGVSKPAGWLKEAVNLNDKFHLIEMLQYGNLLKIFPMQDKDDKILWYAPNMDVPAQADSADNVFVRHFLPLYYEALLQGDVANANMLVDKLIKFQQKQASDTLPSSARLKAEQIYNRARIFSLLFKICLTIGSIGLMFFIFCSIRNKSIPKLEKSFQIALGIVFVAATVGLGLRTFIGGRLPVSNTYETMILLAWLSLLTGVLVRRYSFLIVTFSFLLAGFTLLVAHIASINPQITPLTPVLQSPLLSIHVLTIMVAYGLCGFMALNSLSAFIVWLFDRKSAFVKRMKETSELFMYPATFLMGAGIFIGAIWANMSWGRYWGWDPKEVWALITFLLMGFTFHDSTLTWFRRPLFYHFFVIIIFLSVLMTYFGVNYILGGIHSYAD